MSRLPFVELAFSQLRSRSHAMAVVGVVFVRAYHLQSKYKFSFLFQKKKKKS